MKIQHPESRKRPTGGFLRDLVDPAKAAPAECPDHPVLAGPHCCSTAGQAGTAAGQLVLAVELELLNLLSGPDWHPQG